MKINKTKVHFTINVILPKMLFMIKWTLKSTLKWLFYLVELIFSKVIRPQLVTEDLGKHC